MVTVEVVAATVVVVTVAVMVALLIAVLGMAVLVVRATGVMPAHSPATAVPRVRGAAGWAKERPVEMVMSGAQTPGTTGLTASVESVRKTSGPMRWCLRRMLIGRPPWAASRVRLQVGVPSATGTGCRATEAVSSTISATRDRCCSALPSNTASVAARLKYRCA